MRQHPRVRVDAGGIAGAEAGGGGVTPGVLQFVRVTSPRKSLYVRHASHPDEPGACACPSDEPSIGCGANWHKRGLLPTDPAACPSALEIGRISLLPAGPQAEPLPLPATPLLDAPGSWLRLGPVQPLPHHGVRYGWPLLADMNGDGHADLVVRYYDIVSDYLHIKIGWMTALGDGQGHCGPSHAAQANA